MVIESTESLVTYKVVSSAYIAQVEDITEPGRSFIFSCTIFQRLVVIPECFSSLVTKRFEGFLASIWSLMDFVIQGIGFFLTRIRFSGA